MLFTISDLKADEIIPESIDPFLLLVILLWFPWQPSNGINEEEHRRGVRIQASTSGSERLTIIEFLNLLCSTMPVDNRRIAGPEVTQPVIFTGRKAFDKPLVRKE